MLYMVTWNHDTLVVSADSKEKARKYVLEFFDAAEADDELEINEFQDNTGVIYYNEVFYVD